jgi:hypothetical protein
MEPMSKFCDPLYNIYKIPWAQLLGTPPRPLERISTESSGPASCSSVSNPDTPSSADADRTAGPLRWIQHPADPFSC